MKTIQNFRKLFVVAGMVLTISSAFTMAQAQEKGGTKLLRLQATQDVQAVQPAAGMGMSCPKCKDVNVTVADRSSKGTPGATVIPVHQCPSCETKIVTTGQGKQATDQVAHSCAMPVSMAAGCCAMKGNGSAAGASESKASAAMSHCPM